MEVFLLVFVVIASSIEAHWEIAGVNLGRGYDLILGNPLFLQPGDERGSAAMDPGMKSNRVLKLEEDELRAAATKQTTPIGSECVFESRYIPTPLEYRKRLLRETFFENLDWHHPLKDFALTGSGNAEFPEKALFLDEFQKCVLNYVFKTEDIQMNSVTDDFTRAVCDLPEEIDETEYRKFIINFGTSVLTSAQLGTMEVHRFMKSVTNMPSVRQQITSGEPEINRSGQLARGISEMVVKVTDEMMASLNKSDLKTEPESRRVWVIGNRMHPAVVKLGLDNIDKFVDEKYWPSCPDETNDCCERLPKIQSNIKDSLNNYPRQLGVIIPRRRHPLYPIGWPEGTYSMIQSSFGCPAEADYKWETGTVIHMQGAGTRVEGDIRAVPLKVRRAVKRKNAIEQNFCTKKTKSKDERPWPKGSYCIYKHGDCPGGFNSGWIYWDDVAGGSNTQSGTIPDGVYGSNTQIFFCCRKDASPESEIVLPINEPFTLMRVGKKCQNVKWARTWQSSVHFDGAWTSSWFRNEYFMGGAHPDNDLEYSNNKLFYCLYTADNQVRTNLIRE